MEYKIYKRYKGVKKDTKALQKDTKRYNKAQKETKETRTQSDPSERDIGYKGYKLVSSFCLHFCLH